MSEDRIEREISIDAPVDRVWAVLTEPDLVSDWFSPAAPAEIDLRPGGTMRLDHGQHGLFPMTIVDVDPPRYLSYRWASGFPGQAATEDNSTLVEFTLTPAGTGTQLRLVESGFAGIDLPADRVAAAGYDSHAQGWPEVVRNLRKLAEAG